MRIISQFSPYNWTEYNWRPMASFRHWIIVLTIILVYSLSEIGTFYLKYILWIPPPHPLVHFTYFVATFTIWDWKCINYLYSFSRWSVACFFCCLPAPSPCARASTIWIIRMFHYNLPLYDILKIIYLCLFI